MTATTGPAPKAYESPRETRRRELGRLTRARLAAMVNRDGLYPAGELASWRKDELVSTLLDRAFAAPAAVPTGAEV